MSPETDQHRLNLVINRSWLWTSKLQLIRKWWDWMEPQNLWQLVKIAIDKQLSNSWDFGTALTFTRSIVHRCVVLEGSRTGVEWKHYLFLCSSGSYKWSYKIMSESLIQSYVRYLFLHYTHKLNILIFISLSCCNQVLFDWGKC